jgi:prophage antirepressor-like protein
MSQSAIADFEIRVIKRDGEPWFVLNDVCHVLGIGNPSMAARRLRDREKDDLSLADPIGREQETTIISEQGLYRLVMRSDKQEARSFQDWVVGEVLPSIRKTRGTRRCSPRRSPSPWRQQLLSHSNVNGAEECVSSMEVSSSAACVSITGAVVADAAGSQLK